MLAKIAADTAANEQHFSEILPVGRRVADHGCRRRRVVIVDERADRDGLSSRLARSAARREQLSRDAANFTGLVLGCIEAKFCT